MEVDSQGNELTEAQQVPVLDDFFNALDNAIDNRQRMLDGDTGVKRTCVMTYGIPNSSHQSAE